MQDFTYASLHNHTMYSNLRLKDAITRPEELLNQALDYGIKGLVVTDHETLSAHVTMQQYVNKNSDKFKDFKLGFGNEIYLVDRNTVEELKENNESIKFYHFILIAKDEIGYDFLRKQSTQAWKNGFMYKGMERVPTYYDWLKETMKQYKGHVIASSACLGGILPNLLLNKQFDKFNQQVKEFQEIFGKDDFYLEVQPNNNAEQNFVNHYLLQNSKELGVKVIVTTDTHYLNKKQQDIHRIFLKSDNSNRDVDNFYEDAYMKSPNEIYTEMGNTALELFDNTLEILYKIEVYDLHRKIEIPQAHIPNFKEYYTPSLDKYRSIAYYQKTSESESDKYLWKLIVDGLREKKVKPTKEIWERIDTELDVIKAIGDYFGKPMSGYFLAEKEFIDLMWQVSLVGIGRGSAPCFYICYLVGITQIDALEYDLPYWRFANKDRLDNIFDIDTDSEGAQREAINKLIKDKFGYDNVINAGTFKTEASKSTVLSATRGYGLSVADSQNIVNLLPNDKGVSWSLKDTFFGNEDKGRKPDERFISAVNQHKGLQEAMLGIEGLVSGRSQHAAGVFVMNGGYDNYFASMNTTSGLEVSQLDAHSAEYVGGIKYDFLTIEALDRIREVMRLLLKDGKIEWQGSLRDTFNHYFALDKFDVNNKEMYDLMLAGEVNNVFQFSTRIGRQGVEKVQPHNFNELAATNSLIRLTTDGEQPIDKYVKFKNDPTLWFKEMTEQGLTEDEQKVLNNLLEPRYGICDTQEYLMQMVMDKDISNFTLKQANKMRKSVAKKNPELQQQEKDLFFKQGIENGTSENMLNYVWDYEIAPLLG